MKLIKKTMIFLAVLLVGLLAVSSVSASDIVNESNDFLTYENNEEITEVVDDSVMSIELDNSSSADTELDKIGNCLDNEIGLVDKNLENETEDILQENGVKIIPYPVKDSSAYTFRVLDSNNNPIPDEYFSYKYLSHSGAAYTDSDGVGYIFVNIPWDMGIGNYPIKISSSGITVTLNYEVLPYDYLVEEENGIAKYKKTNFLKLEITTLPGYEPVKNLKLALKIYTGKKYKTYYIKTNNKGIAKFNTKNLKIGMHKYILTSTNKKYKIKEYGTILIEKATKKTIKKTTTAKKTKITKKTTTKKKSNTKTVTKGKFKATFSLSTWNIAKRSPGMWDKQVKNTGIKKYNGKTVKAYLSTYGKKIRVSWSAGGRQLAIKNIGTTIR